MSATPATRFTRKDVQPRRATSEPAASGETCDAVAVAIASDGDTAAKQVCVDNACVSHRQCWLAYSSPWQRTSTRRADWCALVPSLRLTAHVGGELAHVVGVARGATHRGHCRRRWRVVCGMSQPQVADARVSCAKVTEAVMACLAPSYQVHQLYLHGKMEPCWPKMQLAMACVTGRTARHDEAVVAVDPKQRRNDLWTYRSQTEAQAFWSKTYGRDDKS